MTEIVDERQRLVARLRDMPTSAPGVKKTYEAAADLIERDGKRLASATSMAEQWRHGTILALSARVAALEGLLSEVDLVDAGDRALIAVKNGSGRDWVRRVTAALASRPQPRKATDAEVEAAARAEARHHGHAESAWPAYMTDAKRLLDAAFARSVSPAAAQGWQTIETAPQRKCVLLGKAGTPMVVEGYVPNPASGWRHAHSSDPICFEPTHWHPLPAAPPAPAAQEQEKGHE